MVSLIFIILVGLIISPFIIEPIINNVRLHSFAEQLEKVPLPQDTKIIDKQSVCGKLNGNGNGMDYFASILIKSDLELNQLKEHYAKEKFRTVKKDEDHNITFEIIPANGYELETSYLRHQHVYFEDLKDIDDYDGYYVVIIYDGGYSVYFDIRGG